MHSSATTEPLRPPPCEAPRAAAPRLAAAAGLFLAFLAAQALHAQSLLPLSDYQVILDRKPFGELGKPKDAGADAEASQAAAEAAQAERDQQSLAQQLDLVAVNVTLRGTVSVGLVDKSVNPARSIYLAVGESDSGYTVESADYTAETATISKGGVKVTLKLGRGLVEGGGEAATGDAAAGGAAAAGEAAGPEQRRQVPRALRRPGAPGAAGYRSAIMERRRAENAAADEAESRRREHEVERLRQASDKAAAKREHDMNYQLLLEGKEPVSEIHLTPEEERELESRGLLAPADSAPPAGP